MNLHTSIICITAFILVGCTKKPNPLAEIEIEWNQATYSLKDYKDMQPGRPILAIFIPEWDLMGEIQRKILMDETSKRILKGSRFLCLWYDCTKSDSLGMTELKRLDRNYFPAAVFIDGSSAEDRVCTPPIAKEEIYDFLRNLRIEAEQGA